MQEIQEIIGSVGGTKYNDFNTDLKFSIESSSELFWQSIYSIAFPDMICQMPNIENSQSQHLGVDRIIHLKSGRTLYIDEKKRRDDWGDILLEYKSNSNNYKNDGWMNKQLLIDYLAYAFMPKQKVYLLDWLSLRRVWLNCGVDWLQKAKSRQEGFRIVSANNNKYKTLSIAIPTDILLEKMNNYQIITL